MTALLLMTVHLALPVPRPVHRLRPATPDIRWLAPVGTGLAAAVVLLFGNPGVALAALFVLGTVVRVVREARAGAARRRRESHAATFLGHLARELQAGNDLTTALSHAAGQLPVDAPPELSDLLHRVGGLTRRGCSAAGILREGPPELRPLGTLWELSERHGLPLVPLVEQAQLRIDTRLRHRAATRATLQGPQATAVILTLLPLAGIAMGTAMGAHPLGLLFGGGLGGLLLVTGVALTAGGFLWSGHIIRRAAA